MFKAASKDGSPPASVSSVTTNSSLSSKAGKLKVTPEGGLRLEGDGGVLGKGHNSSSQQGEKQKFFATRSADGKWNLLMAPTSDPSRLFLVQPAPGHRFQVAGGSVRMESTSTASPSSSAEVSSAANGCVEELSSASPESADVMPGSSTSKSIAVPVAQLRSSSSVSPLASSHITTATTPTNVATTTSAAEPVPALNTQDQKKPSFFKSRTARDREALKASAQHVVGKKVLRGSKPAVNSPGGDNSKKKKKNRSPGAVKSHGKSSKLPSSLQESMSQSFSQMSVSPGETSSTLTSATFTSAPTVVTFAEVATTLSSPVTLSTSTTSTSSSSSLISSTRITSSVTHRTYLSPSSSPLQFEPTISAPTSPLSIPGSPTATLESSFRSQAAGQGDAMALDSEDGANTEKDYTDVDHDHDMPCDSIGNAGEPCATTVASSAENFTTESEKDPEKSSSDSSVAENESSANADISLGQDFSYPHYSTDFREKSPSGGRTSPQSCGDGYPNSESGNDDVDGNGHGSSSERRDYHSKDDDTDSQGQSIVHHESDGSADQDNSAAVVSNIGTVYSPQFCNQNESSAASDIQMATSAESQHTEKSSVEVSCIETSLDRSSTKRKRASEELTDPGSGSASDTDDYEFVISDAENEAEKPSTQTETVQPEDPDSVMTESEEKELVTLSSQRKLRGDSGEANRTVLESESVVCRLSTQRKSSRDSSQESDSCEKTQSSRVHSEDQIGTEAHQSASMKLADTEDNVLACESEQLLTGRDKDVEMAGHTDSAASDDQEVEPQGSVKSYTDEVSNREELPAEGADIEFHREASTSQISDTVECSESCSVLEPIPESSESVQMNSADLNIGVITSSKQTKQKKRKKRKSELENLMESQAVECEDSGVSMPVSENEPALSEDTADEEPKDSNLSPQEQESSGLQEPILESPTQKISRKEKQKKKKKKKGQLKILINLSESDPKATTVMECTNATPSAVLDPELEGQNRPLTSTSKDSEETPDAHPEQAAINAAENQDGRLKSSSEITAELPPEFNLKIGRPKKKKKKATKLKIIFGNGRETSTREIAGSAVSDSSSRNESDVVSDTPAADSLGISQTSADNTALDENETQAAISVHEKPKKTRRKRLTELETLIQDQETLSRSEAGTVSESPRPVSDNGEGSDIESVETSCTREVKTMEVDRTKETGNSEAVPNTNPEDVEETPSVPERVVLESGFQKQQKDLSQTMSRKAEKAKKRKKRKKMPTAGVIRMPQVMPAMNTDAAEPIVDTRDVPDPTKDTSGPDSSLPTNSALPQNAPNPDDSLPATSILPPLSDDTGSDSTDTDEEEDAETKARKAMKKFLKSRSFTRWQMASMFGTPFVVLERLSEKDVFFMSRRFRNARVSSRSKCSAHCRMRTLNYLCELKLIDCRPPAGFKRTLPDITQGASDAEPPKKKKRKKDDKGEEDKLEDKEGKKKKKRKKMSTDEPADTTDKADADDVICIEGPDKTRPRYLVNPVSLLSGIPTSSAGRIVRLAPMPNRPGFLLPTPGRTTLSAGARFITVPPIATSGTSSLPQVISFPSLAASSSGASRIVIPPLVSAPSSTTSPSLRDTTRASLAKAISNSLTKTGHVVPSSTTSSAAVTGADMNNTVVSVLPGMAPVLSRGPVVGQAPITSGTTSTTQSGSILPKQFYVVQMGDKRMLVPASALTVATTPTTTTMLATTAGATSTASLGVQSLVNTTSVPRFQGNIPTVVSGSSLVNIPTVVGGSSPGVRVSTPNPSVPGSVARIVLSNRRGSATFSPRTAPTASTLLFANRPALGTRPNQPWIGPRTVDSQRRIMVTPASQPQGIRVVLSGAGGVSSGTRFTVASSRGGVLMATRPVGTSLVRMAATGQTRPGKRVMTEEERLRKRARLEKKYPLPPGVVIKTEPVTQGYGDEGKTVQAGTATRVYVSTVPVGTTSGRAQPGFNQPIPVMPAAIRGSPIIIRQASSSSTQRGSSLLAPLIIRVPSTVTATSATSTVPRSAVTTSLLSSSARLAATTTTSAPTAISLLNNRSLIAASSGSSVSSQPTSAAPSISSAGLSGICAIASSAASVATTSSVTSSELRSVDSANAAQSDDDAIYIADSPPPETPARDPPRSRSVPVDTSSSSVSSPPVTLTETASQGPPSTTPSPPTEIPSSSVPPATSSVPSTAVTTVTIARSSASPLSTSSPASPVPSTTTLTPSHLASLGAMWVRQATESPDSIPSINTGSLQAERMRRLKETLAKQMGSVGDERRQKALQALHKQFCQAQRGGNENPAVEGHGSIGTTADRDQVTQQKEPSALQIDVQSDDDTVETDASDTDRTDSERREEIASDSDSRVTGNNSETSRKDGCSAESEESCHAAESGGSGLEPGTERGEDSENVQDGEACSTQSDDRESAEGTAVTENNGRNEDNEKTTDKRTVVEVNVMETEEIGESVSGNNEELDVAESSGGEEENTGANTTENDSPKGEDDDVMEHDVAGNQEAEKDAGTDAMDITACETDNSETSAGAECVEIINSDDEECLIVNDQNKLS